MANLLITLLGSFTATIDEHPIPPFRTRSVQALLIYLLCEADRPHTREALMTLLWPGMPQESAQANLRQTLYRLRKQIPAVNAREGAESVPLVLANRQHIQVNPAAAYILDTEQFIRTEPREAIALYRGDFLADFYLPDSDAFEDWSANHRANYRRQMLGLLEAETAARIRQKRFQDAARLAQQQLHIDNLREPAHRQLMEALARDGRREEALVHSSHARRHFISCRHGAFSG